MGGEAPGFYFVGFGGEGYGLLHFGSGRGFGVYVVEKRCFRRERDALGEKEMLQKVMKYRRPPPSVRKMHVEISSRITPKVGLAIIEERAAIWVELL